MDQGHVAVPHAEDEVVLPVRKQALDHIQQGGVAALQLPDDEHAAGDLRRHVQFLGPHVDVAEHDVVGDDVLDERAPVVLLLVVALRAVEGHAGHGADGVAHLVVPHGEHRIVEPGAPAPQGAEGPPLR